MRRRLPVGLLIKPKPPKPEPPGGGNFAQLVEDAVVAMLRFKPNKTGVWRCCGGSP